MYIFINYLFDSLHVYLKDQINEKKVLIIYDCEVYHVYYVFNFISSLTHFTKLICNVKSVSLNKLLTNHTMIHLLFDCSSLSMRQIGENA